MVDQHLALPFILTDEHVYEVPHECTRCADVIASVNDQILKLSDWLPVLEDHLVVFFQRRIINAIEIVPNHFKFVNSVRLGFNHYFSESEVKTANLPTLLAREEPLWVGMALLQEGEPVFSFSGYSQERELTQEILFLLHQRLHSILPTLLLFDNLSYFGVNLS